MWPESPIETRALEEFILFNPRVRVCVCVCVCVCVRVCVCVCAHTMFVNAIQQC